MLNKILVPIDFSACADNAVNFAVQSAKILPVEIVLMHAMDIRGSVYNDYLGVNKEYNQEILHDMKTKVAKLKRKIEENEGVLVSTHISTGRLKESVNSLVEDLHIDLVVMGTSGASGVIGKIWGSNTAAVIGNCKVPVLAIPQYYKWKKPQTILLSSNHFEKDHAVLDIIFEMADLFMASVKVAVFTDIEAEKVGGLLDHTRQIPQYEKFLKESYHENTLTAYSLSGLHFEESLQEFIDWNEVDMMVMVTYKRNLLDKILKPSMTNKMSYQTEVPLLAIPAQTEVQAEPKKKTMVNH